MTEPATVAAACDCGGPPVTTRYGRPTCADCEPTHRRDYWAARAGTAWARAATAPRRGNLPIPPDNRPGTEPM